MKGNIRLNTNLITSLSAVLCMPALEMIAATGISTTMWYSIKQRTNTVTIQCLLHIANGLHIPVRRLFSFGPTDDIGVREDYVVESYLPCHYDGDKLRQIVSSRSDATWQKASETTGVTPLHLRKSLTGETRTPVNRFLAVCEAFDIDPFTILIDPNPLYNNKKKKNATNSNEYDAILANIAAIQRDMANYKALLEETRRDIAKFGEKLDAIIGASKIQSPPKRTKRTALQTAKIVKEVQEQQKVLEQTNRLIVNDK